MSNGEVPASSGKIMPIGFNKVGTREVLDIEVNIPFPRSIISVNTFYIGMSDCHSFNKRCT